MVKKRKVEWSDEIEIEVKATVYPGSPGRMYMRNGDPGDPPEAPETDIDSVIIMIGGKPLDITEKLTEAQAQWLHEKLCEQAHDSAMAEMEEAN